MTGDQIKAFARKRPVIAVSAVVSVLCALVIYFRLDQLDEAKAALEVKEKEGGALDTNLRNAAGLPEQYEALTAASKDIQGRMLHLSQLAGNLRFFYEVESATGTKLLDLHQTTTGKLVSKTAYLPIGFSFSVKGSAREVMDVLRHLETGGRYCRIITAAITAVSTDPTGNTLNATFSIELLGLP